MALADQSVQKRPPRFPCSALAWAALPTAEEAALLGIAASDPCLIVVRRTFTRDAAITIARLVQPGSRYTLHGEFAP